MMGDLEIRDLIFDCFGGMEYCTLIYPILTKVILNEAWRYYANQLVSFFTHESIHYILLREEGDNMNRQFDNLFPDLYSSSCLVDGTMERHLLWRKKFGVKELITEV